MPLPERGKSGLSPGSLHGIRLRREARGYAFSMGSIEKSDNRLARSDGCGWTESSGAGGPVHPIFGGPRAATLTVQRRISKNQRFSGMDREEVPVTTVTILPPALCLGTVADRFETHFYRFLQVPVVAPAGFRSPGAAKSGAVPPACSSKTRFGQPGERYAYVDAVEITASAVVRNANTCETKSSRDVRREIAAWAGPDGKFPFSGSIVG